MSRTQEIIEAKKKRLERRYGRLDSWQNPFTGLNTTRDKMTYATFGASDRLDDDTLENLYAEDGMAARICDTMPEYSLRKGIEIKISPDEDQTEIEDKNATVAELKKTEGEIQDVLTDLEAFQNFVDSAVWANVFGACAIVIGGADGAQREQLKEPLNEDRINEITHLNVVEKRYLTPIKWYEDPTQPKFGTPETYLITPNGVSNSATATAVEGSVEIHETRLLMFGGTRTSTKRRQNNDGWKDSLLQRLHMILSQFGQSFDTLVHIMSDAAQGVFKMEGYIDALAADEADVIEKRMQLIDISRSSIRATVLDAGADGSPGESFERQNFTWAGIEKPYEIMMMRLSAEARMPVSVIMGKAPQGMDATGEHDMLILHDAVEAYREGEILKNLNTLVRLIFKSKQGPTKGKEPDKWSISFPPIWSMTEKQKAEIYEAYSRADKNYIDTATLLPEEVAISRFGPDGFGKEIMIDLNSRDLTTEETEDELETSTPPEEPTQTEDEE